MVGAVMAARLGPRPGRVVPDPPDRAVAADR